MSPDPIVFTNYYILYIWLLVRRSSWKSRCFSIPPLVLLASLTLSWNLLACSVYYSTGITLFLNRFEQKSYMTVIIDLLRPLSESEVTFNRSGLLV